MAAYSMDLRERVVAACDDGVDTRAEIAERFSVSQGRSRRLLPHRRETGSIAPRPRLRGRGGRQARGRRRGRPRCHAEGAGDRRGGRRHLGDRPGTEASGDHAQKKSTRAAEQDRPDLRAAREARREESAGVDPSRLVFLDESGETNSMTRCHGRDPRGERVDAAAPHGHWEAVALTAAVRLGGVGACLAFDGAAACFEAYVGECLVPTLKPGDIVVMDTCRATGPPRSSG